MQNIETIRSPKAPLFLVPDFEPFESTEKYIYKMTDGRNIVAAKIFKEDNYTMPRPYRVKEEIRATKVLKRTPLGIYIPEYMYPLVDEHGKLVGIAVRWEEGAALGNMGDQRPLSQKEFDQFEGAILATIDIGFIPNEDTIHSNNVMFNPDRSPRIWFAECMLETERFNLGDDYVFFYEDALDEVKGYIGN